MESDSPPVDLQALHAKMGQLTLENDFLGNALNKAGHFSLPDHITLLELAADPPMVWK